MPEGPEVKIASKYFNNFFKESKEIKFEILTNYYHNKYNDVFTQINKHISTFEPTYTVGKNIFMNLNRNLIFNFHLGMTGGWSNQLIKHCHFRVYSASKELFFKDIRKFGKMRIISKDIFNTKHISYYDMLNKEYNYNMHIKFLEEKVGKKRSVCSILMDQRYFPGVGNYIKSEALYLSMVHPEEKWINIPRNKKEDIVSNTRNIMLESYTKGGAELRDFNNPFNKSKYKLKIYNKDVTEDGNIVTSKLTSDSRKSWFCLKKQKLSNSS